MQAAAELCRSRRTRCARCFSGTATGCCTARPSGVSSRKRRCSSRRRATSQIARTIARGLRLNEDLTEAISLAHDLGHTPFGHAGEKALDALCPDGFRHYMQSLRVVDRLEKDGEGLNLTWEVRNGIVTHTKGTWAATPEGRIVRLADQIAFVNHDIEDAVRAGVLDAATLPKDCTAVLGQTKSARITTMINSILTHSEGDVRMGT